MSTRGQLEAQATARLMSMAAAAHPIASAVRPERVMETVTSASSTRTGVGVAELGGDSAGSEGTEGVLVRMRDAWRVGRAVREDVGAEKVIGTLLAERVELLQP